MKKIKKKKSKEASEYFDDLALDKHSLDEELVRQADLFMKWSERYANALYEFDKEKENIEIVSAEIDYEIRDDFKKFGFDKKPTETAIKFAIISDDRYKKVNSILAKAKKNVNILAAAKEAMSHKKKALEKLVDLWIANYYSDPKMSKIKENQLDLKLRKRRKTQ